MPMGCALYPKTGLQPRGGQPSAAFGLLGSTTSSDCLQDKGSWNMWCLTKLKYLPSSLGMAQVLGSTDYIGLGEWL